MATVNLSWTVEGLHDGIRVEREFKEHVDYLDTLPAGTTEFEDDFSISALATHYGVLPEDIELLTYTLTTFRGDKEKSTVVRVPIVDTDPQWLVDADVYGVCGSKILDVLSIPGVPEDFVPIYVNDYHDSPDIDIVLVPANSVYIDQVPFINLDGEWNEESHINLLNLDINRLINMQLNTHYENPSARLEGFYFDQFSYPFDPEIYNAMPRLSIYGPHSILNNDNLFTDMQAALNVQPDEPITWFVSAPYANDTGGTLQIDKVVWDGTGFTFSSAPFDPEELGYKVYVMTMSMAHPKPPCH